VLDRGSVRKDSNGGIKLGVVGMMGQGVEAGIWLELRYCRWNLIAGRLTSLWRRGKRKIWGGGGFRLVIDVVHYVCWVLSYGRSLRAGGVGEECE